MNVLIVSGMSNTGGTERATLNHIDAIKNKNINIILLSDDGPYVKNIKDFGVRHIKSDIHIKKSIWGTIITLFKLPKIIKQNDIEIIHAQMAFPTLLSILGTLLAKRYKKTKIIWHSRGLHKKTYSKVCKLFNLFDIYALGNCKQEMHKLINNGLNSKKVNYIYNNFSEKFFSLYDEKINCSNFGISSDEIVIGSVARLEPDRNVDIFLEICSDLSKKTNKPLKFLICGGGSQEKYLKEYAIKLGIANKTIFLGSQTKMYSVYKMMDIMLNTLNLPQGEGAGVGNNLIEAFFSKVLVVANDVVAVSEIVKENETGYLIKIDEYDKTINKIISIIDNYKKDMFIKENAYQFAQNMFSSEKYSEKIHQIYKKVILNEDIDNV